jgi:hypothetical protein
VSRAARFLAVAAVLLACGSDDDATGTTTSSSSTTTTTVDPVTTATGSSSTAPPSTAVVFTAPTEPTCVEGRVEDQDATPVGVAGSEDAGVEVLTDVDGPFLVLYGESSLGLTPIAGGAELGPPPRIASVLDLDGDGTDEVWVQAGSGASVLLYGLYRVDGCLLAPVALGGVPSSFPVGGTVGTQVGVFCTDSGGVAAVMATSDDGERYVGDRIDYRLEGGELVQQTTEPFELLASDPSFPDLAAFRC